MKTYIDEMEIESVREGGELTLSTVMAYDGDLPEGSLQRLAELAAGRMARESAFPCREAGSDAVKLVAVREIPVGDAEGEKEFLEEFLNSADWWSDRLREMKSL